MSFHVHIYGEGKTASCLASGLRWSVLSAAGSKKVNEKKTIRNQASLIGAQGYAVYSYEGTKLLGLYTQPPRLPGAAAPPKTIYSLALAFLSSLSQSGVDIRIANAILLVEPRGMPDKRALVVIEGGQIIRDMVDSTMDAIASAQSARDSLTDHQIYSQYPEIPGASDVDWDFLAHGCDKSALLVAVPRSPATLIVIMLAILAGAGWFGYQELVVKPEKARQKKLAAIKANKTPEYMALLRSSLSAVGWDSADLQAQITALKGSPKGYPFYYKGWALEKRECVAANQSCTTQWRRTGGQLPSLFALLPNAKYDVVSSNLDTAKMDESSVMVRSSQQPEQMQTLEEVSKKLRESLQKLANADVVVSTGPAEKWPQMNYSGVDPKVIAVRASVEIVAPLPIVVAALRELPPTVIIDKFTLDVSSGDVGNLFKVSVKGYVYAK